MKYLKTREVYLSSINETFVNETTWGGSLLGRLVNSVIRKAKIGVNYLRIDSITKAIEDELNALIAGGLNDKDKKDLTETLSKAFMQEIYDTVHDTEMSEKEKLSHLLGSNPEDGEESKGLIDACIDWVNKVELTDKEDLIRKLTKFKDELSKLKPEESADEEEKKDDKPKGLPPGGEQPRLEAGAKILLDVPENKVKIQKFKQLLLNPAKMTYADWLKTINKSDDKAAENKDTKTFSEWLDFYNQQNPDDSSDVFTSGEKMSYTDWLNKFSNKDFVEGTGENGEKTFAQWLKSHNPVKEIEAAKKDNTENKKDYYNATSTSSDHHNAQDYEEKDNKKNGTEEYYVQDNNSRKHIITNFYDFLKIYETQNRGVAVIDKTKTSLPAEVNNNADDNNKNANDASKTIVAHPIGNAEDNTKDAYDRVKKAYYNYFEENEHHKWTMDEKTKQQYIKNFENAKFTINLNDENDKDRIIKIANLFGKAYRLFTVTSIPSGRPNGVISNKTYSEYLYVGKGETPSNRSEHGPGKGPWANKLVFHKYADKISGLIEHNKYKKIFNVGTIKRTDGKSMSGNVLLEFIRNMIDENSLYSYDENRTKLLNKYFGLDARERPTDNNVRDTKNDLEVDSADKKTNQLYWENVNYINVSDNSEIGSFIAIDCKPTGGKEKNKTIVGQILAKTDGYILIKYQFGQEAIPLTYGGDIPVTKRYFPDTNKTTANVFIGLIKIPNNNIKINEKFSISRRILGSKEDDKKGKGVYQIMEYMPILIEHTEGTVTRTTNKHPTAVLVYQDEKGKSHPKIGNINQINTSKILYDKKVDIKDEITDAMTEFNKNK